MGISTLSAIPIVLLCADCMSAEKTGSSIDVSQTAWRQLQPERLMYGTFPLYRVKVGERNATIIMPSATPKTKSLSWVIYHTGAGENCDTITYEGDYSTPPYEPKGPIIKRLLENGFLVCTITSGEQHWGDPSAEEAHEALYRYVTATFPVGKKVNLLAQSMGGTSAYPWASHHPERVKRIYGIYAITNLDSMGSRNAILNLEPLAAHKVSILHRHGTADTVVPFDKNAQQFEDTYKKLGGKIRITPVPGLGHQYDPLFFVSKEVTDFFLGKIF